MVLAHAVSDAGPVRKNNEDSCAVEARPAALRGRRRDGRTQRRRGRLPARRRGARRLHPALPRRHRFRRGRTASIRHLSLQANRLRTAINLANRRVFRAAESHDDYTGMGTTVVAALIAATRLIVGQRRRQPAVSSEPTASSRSHPGRHVGGDDAQGRAGSADPHALRQPPDAARADQRARRARADRTCTSHDLPLTAGERVLLCSDGLYGAVDDPRSLNLTLGRPAMSRPLRDRLVQLALEQGTRDNVTALVVRVRGRRRE